MTYAGRVSEHYHKIKNVTYTRAEEEFRSKIEKLRKRPSCKGIRELNEEVNKAARHASNRMSKDNPIPSAYLYEPNAYFHFADLLDMQDELMRLFKDKNCSGDPPPGAYVHVDVRNIIKHDIERAAEINKQEAGALQGLTHLNFVSNANRNAEAAGYLSSKLFEGIGEAARPNSKKSESQAKPNININITKGVLAGAAMLAAIPAGIYLCRIFKSALTKKGGQVIYVNFGKKIATASKKKAAAAIGAVGLAQLFNVKAIEGWWKKNSTT